MSRLEVADDEAWVAALGVRPNRDDVSGDAYVRGLIIPISSHEEIRVTWNISDSSVRVRHQRSGITVCDLFREMATRLTVVGPGSAPEVIVEYGSRDWSGRTRIHVLPEVHIEDRVLKS